MELTSADPNQLLPDLDRLRTQVRADQRTTSAPLFAFGALIIGYAVIGGLGAGHLSAADRHATVLLYWPLATALALVALWRLARRRARQDGVGEGRRSYRTAIRGYLIGLLLIVVLGLPVLFIGVFTPMIWPAAVLAVIAAWQRNRQLGNWASAVGVIGGLEGLYILADQGLDASWWWLQPAVYAILGTALVAAGVVIGRRERATA